MKTKKQQAAALALQMLREEEARLRTYVTTPITDAYYIEEEKLLKSLRHFYREDWSALGFEEVLFIMDMYLRYRALPLHNVLGKLREVRPQ